MIDETPGDTTNFAELHIANFWKRILAIIIDFIVLGLFGLCLGLFLGDYFSSLGSSGRYIGLIIAIVYFTVFNSKLGHGQTVGKTVAKIKVVGSQGDSISLPKTFLRSGIFCIPYFLNGAYVGEIIFQSWYLLLLSIVVFGCGLATLYLYVFNRKTRQTLHDLAIGSYVVTETSPSPAICNQVVWRGHYLATLIVLIIAGIAPIFTGNLSKSEPFVSLIPLQAMISHQPDVLSASLNVGTNWFKNSGKEATTTTYLVATVWIKNKTADAATTANGIAEILLAKYPEASKKDRIVIMIVHGFDIGIASSWINKNFSFSPNEWLKRLNPRLPNSIDNVENEFLRKLN